MLYKILEKYSKLKTEHESQQQKENKSISEYDKEIIQNFLQLYDKDVKAIHTNEEMIEKNLQSLYHESGEFSAICKDAFNSYDNLVEYFKEVGDLYNWCTQLEKQVNEVQEQIMLPKVEEDKLDK